LGGIVQNTETMPAAQFQNQAAARFRVWHVKRRYIVAGGGGGGSVYNATAVVGLRICRYEVEEGFGAQKPEMEPLLLSFGSAMSNGGRVRWWEVVGRFVEATAVMWPRIRKHKVGWGPKT
jgi:hypothetical protein